MSDRQVGLSILYQRRLHAPRLQDLLGRLACNVQVRWEDGAAFISQPGASGAEVGLVLQQGPEVLAQTVRLADSIGGDDPAFPPGDVAAIARCDARVVVDWVPDDEVSGMTQAICAFEQEVGGIVFHVNPMGFSVGSFPERAKHALVDDSGAPIAGAALAARLHGRWRWVADGDRSEDLDGTALTITPGGDLIYSDPDGGGGIRRILLEYRVEGADLITDQPSHPREQRTPISFDGDGRLILADLGRRAVYARESAANIFDPDAALYALAGAALHHGVASAHAGDAIIPFLMSVDARGRKTLDRFVADSPATARAQAERTAAALAPDVACAYAYDGFLRQGQQRADAILVEASRPGRAHALTVALAYSFPSSGGAAQASGAIVPFPDTAPSWLGPPGAAPEPVKAG